MAGRYKETPVAKHPAYDQGKAAIDENKKQHAAAARKLRPRTLSREEKKVWDRVAPCLSSLGRLKPHYVDFIAEYCVIKVRLDGLRKQLDEVDWSYITTGRHGVQHKSRPEVAQLNDDWRKWNSLIAQLGLSPATELRFNDRQGSLFDDDDFNNL